ncbi:hypothetical protein EPN87_00010 [archaeon]|nr:MAG: hypothetical protein EPN87_00010 [archaeon]
MRLIIACTYERPMTKFNSSILVLFATVIVSLSFAASALAVLSLDVTVKTQPNTLVSQGGSITSVYTVTNSGDTDITNLATSIKIIKSGLWDVTDRFSGITIAPSLTTLAVGHFVDFTVAFTAPGGANDTSPGYGNYTVNFTATGNAPAVVKNSVLSDVFTVLGPANRIALVSPSAATVGTAFTIKVTMYDGANMVKTDYIGTVHLNSTDATAVLPADYEFTATDKGTKTFTITMKTAGSQTYGVKDLSSGISAISSIITVTGGTIIPVPTKVVMSSDKTSINANGTDETMVIGQLVDQDGNNMSTVNYKIVITTSLGNLTQYSNTTDATGRVYAFLRSYAAGTAIINATTNITVIDTSVALLNPATPVAPTVTSPSSATTTSAPTFNIIGTAQADSLVKIYSDGVIVGSQQLANGNTSFNITVDLVQNATNIFTVTATVSGLESPAANVPGITNEPQAPPVELSIISITPSLNSIGIDVNANITIQFSKLVQISNDNVEMHEDGTDVSIETTVTFDSATKIATIQHPVLKSNKKYVLLIVNVADADGNKVSADGTFITATYYKIMLSKKGTNGWNLISLPVVPSITSIDKVLANVINDIAQVWSYDSANNKWRMWAKGDAASDLNAMTAGNGYWVNYKNATAEKFMDGWGTLLAQGNTTPPQVSLGSGWGLIGYYQRELTENIATSCALKSLTEVVTQTPLWTLLYTFDNKEKIVTPVQDMVPGQGYWIQLANVPSRYMYGPGACE